MSQCAYVIRNATYLLQYAFLIKNKLIIIIITNNNNNKQDFTVNIYFIYNMTLINSTEKYRDLGGSGTVKIFCTVYRDTVKTAHLYTTRVQSVL